MFDNLREQANSTPFYEEEAKFQQAAGTTIPPRGSSNGRILGTTGQQRFILAIMLMLIVCLMGTFVLLVTGRLGLY